MGWLIVGWVFTLGLAFLAGWKWGPDVGDWFYDQATKWLGL